MAILMTERVMCSNKFTHKSNIQELMDTLGLKKLLLGKANGV